MKPFNLESALAGNPVRLRNGAKAFVLADVTKLFEWHDTTKYPLKGVVSSVSSSNEYVCSEHWTKDGSNQSEYFDIIGMWEEPELTQEQILEKAYNEGLKVTFSKALLTDGYEVISKTKEGSYIVRNGTVLEEVVLETEGLDFYKEKPSTVTVTLPRPFKPEIGDDFYYIYSEPYSGILKVASRKFDQDDSNAATQDGNRFRTFDDAQAWLNAMKEVVDE